MKKLFLILSILSVPLIAIGAPTINGYPSTYNGMTGEFDAIGSTASLNVTSINNSIADIGASTGTLRTDFNAEITSRTSGAWNNQSVKVGTATISLGIAAANVQTGTLSATVMASSNTKNVGINQLNFSGTASATTYPRGDGTWATPSGSGDVVASGSNAFSGTNTHSGPETFTGLVAISTITNISSMTVTNATAGTLTVNSFLTGGLTLSSMTITQDIGFAVAFASSTQLGAMQHSNGKRFDFLVTVKKLTVACDSGTITGFNIYYGTSPYSITSSTPIATTAVNVTNTPADITLNNPSVPYRSYWIIKSTGTTGAPTAFTVTGWGTKQ